MCVTPRNGKIEPLIVIFENWGSLQDVDDCQSRPEPKKRARSIERGSAMRAGEAESARDSGIDQAQEKLEADQNRGYDQCCNCRFIE